MKANLGRSQILIKKKKKNNKNILKIATSYNNQGEGGKAHCPVHGV
jgi:hypothetical protein